MNKGQNKKGSGTYHYIFDTVKGSFAMQGGFPAGELYFYGPFTRGYQRV